MKLNKYKTLVKPIILTATVIAPRSTVEPPKWQLCQLLYPEPPNNPSVDKAADGGTNLEVQLAK